MKFVLIGMATALCACTVLLYAGYPLWTVFLAYIGIGVGVAALTGVCCVALHRRRRHEEPDQGFVTRP